jgi:hypothetical protein
MRHMNTGEHKETPHMNSDSYYFASSKPGKPDVAPRRISDTRRIDPESRKPNEINPFITTYRSQQLQKRV